MEDFLIQNLVTFSEFVLDKAENNGCFADGNVADEHNLYLLA